MYKMPFSYDREGKVRERVWEIIKGWSKDIYDCQRCLHRRHEKQRSGITRLSGFTRPGQEGEKRRLGRETGCGFTGLSSPRPTLMGERENRPGRTFTKPKTCKVMLSNITLCLVKLLSNWFLNYHQLELFYKHEIQRRVAGQVVSLFP